MLKVMPGNEGDKVDILPMINGIGYYVLQENTGCQLMVLLQNRKKHLRHPSLGTRSDLRVINVHYTHEEDDRCTWVGCV